MSTNTRVREFSKICAVIAATAVALSFAMPLAANAAAELFMLVGPSGDKAKVSDAGALKVGDGTGPLTVNGTVDLAGQPIVTPRQLPYASLKEAHVAGDEPASTVCEPVPLPQTGKVILKSVAVTTLSSPTTPVAYLHMDVKRTADLGEEMELRVPLTTGGSVPNTRSGVLNFELVARSGLVKSGSGEIYGVSVCLQTANAESGEATFQLNGMRVP
jgi:hypothetical protein